MAEAEASIAREIMISILGGLFVLRIFVKMMCGFLKHRYIMYWLRNHQRYHNSIAQETGCCGFKYLSKTQKIKDYLLSLPEPQTSPKAQPQPLVEANEQLSLGAQPQALLGTTAQPSSEQPLSGSVPDSSLGKVPVEPSSEQPLSGSVPDSSLGKVPESLLKIEPSSQKAIVDELQERSREEIRETSPERNTQTPPKNLQLVSSHGDQESLLKNQELTEAQPQSSSRDQQQPLLEEPSFGDGREPLLEESSSEPDAHQDQTLTDDEAPQQLEPSSNGESRVEATPVELSLGAFPAVPTEAQPTVDTEALESRAEESFIAADPTELPIETGQEPSFGEPSVKKPSVKRKSKSLIAEVHEVNKNTRWKQINKVFSNVRNIKNSKNKMMH